VLRRIRGRPDVSVLIVGAGINGAGLFRDLAVQGVDVVLIDKGDYCSGSSAAPSRMIHGGLRYLEFGEFRLVRESVRERNLLLKNAAHYVRPLPTTIPIFSWFSGAVSCVRRFLHLGGRRPPHRGAVMVKAGLAFYDLFTGKSRLMPRHKFTSRAEALALRPKLNRRLIKTATYYDASITYPERLCVELIIDGQQSCPDAVAANYVSLVEGSGEAVMLRDEQTGETFTLRPKLLVNATGAWIDFANRALGRQTKLISGTKGAHLVLDNDDLMQTLRGEMIYYETSDGRVSVALPWLGKPLVGSTDIRVDDPETVRCEDDEIDYILGALREVTPELTIDRSQILSTFSGVRPLRHAEGGATVQLSRDHHCAVLEPGEDVSFPVYCLVGGKWTTFRAFAEQVTDRVMEHLGLARRTGTEHLPIGGGRDYPKSDEARRAWLARLGQETGLPEERLALLLDRYGTRAAQVAAFVTEGPDGPLTHHPGYTRREIEFLVRHEGVVHLDDLLLRRTAIALLGELTTGLLGELAALLGRLRGWSEQQVGAEVERTLAILREKHRIELRP
jgi:glycerol-3-phosphate dehydrogenase